MYKDRRMIASRFFFIALSGALLAACAAADVESDAEVQTDDQTGGPCDARGRTKCEGTRIATCAALGGRLRWSAADECPGDRACRADRCAEPTPQQRSQAASVASLADTSPARAPGTRWSISGAD